jgi:enoyl-CoA hydratase/carnithine racemase
MPKSDIVVTQAGPVLEVLFNRPEKKNALTGAMYAAVVDAFHRADADHTQIAQASQLDRGVIDRDVGL